MSSNLSKRIRTYRNLLKKHEEKLGGVSIWDYEFSINKVYREDSEQFLIRHEGLINDVSVWVTSSGQWFNSLKEAEEALTYILEVWIKNLAISMYEKKIEVDTTVGRQNMRILSELELKKVLNSI